MRLSDWSTSAIFCGHCVGKYSFDARGRRWQPLNCFLLRSWDSPALPSWARRRLDSTLPDRKTLQPHHLIAAGGVDGGTHIDLGGFAVLLLLAILLPTNLRDLPNPEFYSRIRVGGLLLVAVVGGAAAGALLLARFGSGVSLWIESRFSHRMPDIARRFAKLASDFHRGLDTIDGPLVFLQLSVVSVLMWWIVAIAFFEIARAYGALLQDITMAGAVVLLGSSMLGSLIQLPAVGGGVQLAAISMLQYAFHVSPELAVGCGTLFWLVTSMAVAPVGLILAHRSMFRCAQFRRRAYRKCRDGPTGRTM